MKWIVLLVLAFSCHPAFAADLDGGNKIACGKGNTWTEAAGATSSTFTVPACGAIITNTGANAITIYEAKNSDGSVLGTLRVIQPYASADCSSADTCGSSWLYGGKFKIGCDGSACTADIKGQ